MLISTTKNPAKFLGNDFMSADEIQKLNKKAEDRAKESSTQESKQHQLAMKKEFEKNEKQMTKYAEKIYIESRFKTLEAMVKVALSKR